MHRAAYRGGEATRVHFCEPSRASFWINIKPAILPFLSVCCHVPIFFPSTTCCKSYDCRIVLPSSNALRVLLQLQRLGCDTTTHHPIGLDRSRLVTSRRSSSSRRPCAGGKTRLRRRPRTRRIPTHAKGPS